MSQVELYRLLATGSRYTRDARLVIAVMDDYLQRFGPRLEVAAGGATGIDTLVREWCKSREVPFHEYKINHQIDGLWPSAGPNRNRRMHKEFKPHEVLAFPGGRGTASMTRIARMYGTPVTEVK